MINYTDLDKEKLIKLIILLIIKDNMMRENNMKDVIHDLKNIFNNHDYLKQLANAKNNWLEIPVDKVVDNLISYFETLEYVSV